MEKKTILAIVLSVVIIVLTFVIQSVFFPASRSQQTDEGLPPVAESDGGIDAVGAPIEEPSLPVIPVEEETEERELTFSNNVFDIVFSTVGATIRSMKLRQFAESDGSPVEMVIADQSGRYPFAISLDDYDTSGDTFTYSFLSDRWDFEKRYVFNDNGSQIPFTLRKSFIFKSNDYLMEFRVSLKNEEGMLIPLETYTVGFGPQIGPQFQRLDGRYEYRRYTYYADGKRRDYSRKVKDLRKDIEDRAAWAAIEGKYFLVIAISYLTDFNQYDVGFDTTDIEGLSERSSLYFERDIQQLSNLDDGYRFYIGPKIRDILLRYNDAASNAFGESGLHLENALPSSFWGWLSSGLKFLLELFHRLIPNWGVAIILLTILIKLVFFPLTRKSFESTAKMQALGPKMQELKEKYKKNPQKLNQEMAALYKREKVNPLGGCLPLLLQLPIFFALFQLFNNHFELRGAAFIAPWIADLSQPERVLTLPFSIPLLGPELRLLPFVMVATTFIQQRVSQSPGQSTSQTKILMYAMPLFFFFIMYNMPSGLLLYWTMQSLITFLQQYYSSRLKKRRPKNKE
jgi:YidC/Oxa1 family membrane protein insertase